MLKNRKDFLKNIIGIAGIIATSKSPAIIIKSILGQKYSIVSEENEDGLDWCPYVKRGLIAMWDGEWKNIGGISSPTFEEPYWNDIISGLDIPLENRNSKVFPDWVGYGEKYIDGESNKYSTHAYRFNVDKIISSKEITFEGVWSRSSNGPYNANIPKMSLTCANGGSFIFPYNNTSFYVPTNGGGAGVINIPSLPDTTYPNSISFSCKSGIQVASLNGKVIVTSSRTYDNRGNISTITPFSYNTSSVQLRSRYYTNRLYNRFLSADEVAYNYAIDAERFGL